MILGVAVRTFRHDASDRPPVFGRDSLWQSAIASVHGGGPQRFVVFAATDPRDQDFTARPQPITPGPATPRPLTFYPPTSRDVLLLTGLFDL